MQNLTQICYTLFVCVCVGVVLWLGMLYLINKNKTKFSSVCNASNFCSWNGGIDVQSLASDRETDGL